jgi:transposase
MSNKEKLDREILIKVIHLAQGNITVAADKLKVSRSTIYQYREKYKTVADAIEEARHDFDTELLDRAERRLMEAVDRAEVWAVRYALNKKGGNRGYMEKRGLEMSGHMTEAVKIYLPEKDNDPD